MVQLVLRRIMPPGHPSTNDPRACLLLRGEVSFGRVITKEQTEKEHKNINVLLQTGKPGESAQKNMNNMISREHCVIVHLVTEENQDQYVAYDYSMNGTYINDFRLPQNPKRKNYFEMKGRELNAGDILKFGHLNGGAIKENVHAPQVFCNFSFIIEPYNSAIDYLGYDNNEWRTHQIQCYSDSPFIEEGVIYTDKNLFPIRYTSMMNKYNAEVQMAERRRDIEKKKSAQQKEKKNAAAIASAGVVQVARTTSVAPQIHRPEVRSENRIIHQPIAQIPRSIPSSNVYQPPRGSPVVPLQAQQPLSNQPFLPSAFLPTAGLNMSANNMLLNALSHGNLTSLLEKAQEEQRQQQELQRQLGLLIPNVLYPMSLLSSPTSLQLAQSAVSNIGLIETQPHTPESAQTNVISSTDETLPYDRMARKPVVQPSNTSPPVECDSSVPSPPKGTTAQSSNSPVANSTTSSNSPQNISNVSWDQTPSPSNAQQSAVNDDDNDEDDEEIINVEDDDPKDASVSVSVSVPVPTPTPPEDIIEVEKEKRTVDNESESVESKTPNRKSKIPIHDDEVSRKKKRTNELDKLITDTVNVFNSPHAATPSSNVHRRPLDEEVVEKRVKLQRKKKEKSEMKQGVEDKKKIMKQLSEESSLSSESEEEVASKNKKQVNHSDSDDNDVEVPKKRQYRRKKGSQTSQRRRSSLDSKKSESATKKPAARRKSRKATRDSSEEPPVRVSPKKSKKVAEEEEEEEEYPPDHPKMQCGSTRCKKLNDPDINWVACDECRQWWHVVCRFGTNFIWNDDKRFSCCVEPVTVIDYKPKTPGRGGRKKKIQE